MNFEDIVGTSDALRRVLDVAEKVAPSDSPVLIQGEPGTGKDLLARAIHRKSKRMNGPFVVFNCSAIPESMVMNEMFGHERGAFTGAVTEKKGRIEAADGGTLFVDDSQLMAVYLPAKLLRVLEEKESERVGGRIPIKVDVRIIAASTQDLDAAIQADRSFKNRFSRLNGVSLTLPPLRERREDIPLLAAYFIEMYSKSADGHIAGLSPDALTLLREYHWPANVRELRSVIQRSMIFAEGPMLEVPLEFLRRSL